MRLGCFLLYAGSTFLSGITEAMANEGATRSVVSDVETNEDGNEAQVPADGHGQVENQALPETGSTGHQQEQGYSGSRQQGSDSRQQEIALPLESGPMTAQHHLQSVFPPVHVPPPPGQQILHFYEAQMRDHAAAYASAAAGAGAAF